MHKYRFFIGVAFVVIANIFALMPAYYIGQTFDLVSNAIDQMKSNPDADLSPFVDSLIYFGIFLFGAELIRALFTFLMRQTIIVVSRKVEYDLKNDIYDHYQKLSLSFYKQNKTGDLMNRISEDVSQVRMYLGPAIMYTINLSTLIIVAMINMMMIDATLTLYVMIPFPFLAYFVYLASRTINTKSEQIQRYMSHISSFVQEMIAGIRVVKTYGKESLTESKFENINQKNCEKNIALAKIQAYFFPLMILLIGLSNIIIIYVGGRHVEQGIISTGVIAQFVVYINMLTWPVAAIGWVTSIIQRAAASQERIMAFLGQKPEIVDRGVIKESIEGAITFKNVSFTYPETGIRALDNVSFEVKKGKSIAIVGKAGSGKSTLATLIARLYDPDQGQILIDGHSIEQYSLCHLRKSVGYLPQEAFLFSETVADNISFGTDHSTQEKIEEAARKAHVLHNIRDFSEGFDTRLGERGMTVSGGQRQRLAIARTLLKAPPIYLFDDSFSALDTETEKIICDNLLSVSKDKTSIFITHRVAIAQHLDYIYVLDEGRIAEHGTHKDLCKKKGFYHSLYEHQVVMSEEA